jgi:hypothetical protein
VEDRELLGAVLAGRDPFGDGWVGGLVAEETFEHGASSFLERGDGRMVAQPR